MSIVDHEGGVEYPYHKADVFKALLEAITKISGMSIDKADELSGHILVKAGVSLRSWGENIPISVIELPSGYTRVSVLSTPKTGILFGGLFDLGKNRQNIENIFEFTSKILSGKPQITVDSSIKSINLSPTERIQQLNELLEKGLIIREEFERKKAEILSKI